MPWLVLGFCLLIATILLARWFVSANPAQIVKFVKYGGAALLSLIAAFFAVTGRFTYAAPAGIGALMLLGKWPFRGGGVAQPGAPGGRRWPFGHGKAAPSPGQSSEVAADWVRMVLDHDTGGMAGTILKGRFHGRELADLSFEQLVELLSECHASDEQSAALIATYIERTHGEDWQQRAAELGAKPAAGGGDAKMTLEEAYSVLGLEPGARNDAIRDAHRNLMKKLHPDQGGSTYLASKINEAKDLLLHR